MRDREIRTEIKRRSGPLSSSRLGLCVLVCSVPWRSLFKCAENGLVQQRQPSFLKLPGLLLCKMSPWWPQQHPLGSAPGLPIARPRLQNVAVMTNADCSTLPVINRGIPRPTMTPSRCLLVPGREKGPEETRRSPRAPWNNHPARLVLFRWSFINETLAADLTDCHPSFVGWSVLINPFFYFTKKPKTWRSTRWIPSPLQPCL